MEPAKPLHKHFSLISLLFKVVITRSYFWFHLQRPPFPPASVLHYSGTIRVWEQTTSSTTMADVEMTPTHAVIDKRGKQTRHSLTN